MRFFCLWMYDEHVVLSEIPFCLSTMSDNVYDSVKPHIGSKISSLILQNYYEHLFLKTDMTDDIKKYFNSLLNKVNGLHVIQVTDRDGVPLLRVSHEENIDFALMPSFIPTFTTASDQAGKFGLGRNKTIISMYSNYQVVQMNKLPLILTFVGTENCNTGHILALEHYMDSHLEDIKLAVTEA